MTDEIIWSPRQRRGLGHSESISMRWTKSFVYVWHEVRVDSFQVPFHDTTQILAFMAVKELNRLSIHRLSTEGLKELW